ncbi:hypothetical protein [Streptomyces sp. NPDC091371]|uniref:hypothetical protein n=1 Tax=Streptomyces sp. NPDC091371 TaxID=3155303 RepID=UPI0034188E74
MTDTVGQPDPGAIPPRPDAPPYVAPAAPVPQGPPSGHPPRWAWWVIGIVVPVLGTVTTLLATSAREGGAQPPAGGATAQGAPTASPSTSPTPTPTPTVAPLTPPSGTASASASPNTSSSPDLSAPAGYQARQGRWGAAPPICGETLLVDLDAGVSTSFPLRPTGTAAPTERPATTELEYRADRQGCGMDGISPSSTELWSATGRQVGVLRAGQPQTFENCRAAAGTGFGAVALGGSEAAERGLVRGAALCSVTDQGSVAMALVEDLGKGTAPALGGRLVVWSKG